MLIDACFVAILTDQDALIAKAGDMSDGSGGDERLWLRKEIAALIDPWDTFQFSLLEVLGDQMFVELL